MNKSREWMVVAGVLIALVLAFAVTPAFAQGPHVSGWPRGAGYPFGIFGGVFFGFAHSLIIGIAMAALGALLVTYLPKQTRQIGETAQASPLASLGLGCLTFLVALPLIALLAILIITIPVALIVPVALGAAWLLGWVALGWIVGERVMEAFKAGDSLRVPVIATVAGVLSLAVLGVIPVIGWVITLVVSAIGTGAVILSHFGMRAYPPATAPLAPAPALPGDTPTSA